METYKLQLFQVTTKDDKQKRNFCVDVQEKLEEVELRERFLFRDETIFYA